jgi:hypothetical protein
MKYHGSRRSALGGVPGVAWHRGCAEMPAESLAYHRRLAALAASAELSCLRWLGGGSVMKQPESSVNEEK